VKKPKTLEVKLRSAIRLIWSRSAERRAVIKAVTNSPSSIKPFAWFTCPICDVDYPIQMAEVDHDPALGSFSDWRDVKSFIERMFFGPQRVLCKICHKKRTAEQRKKHK
jgi:hypothetical protein